MNWKSFISKKQLTKGKETRLNLANSFFKGAKKLDFEKAFKNRQIAFEVK